MAMPLLYRKITDLLSMHNETSIEANQLHLLIASYYRINKKETQTLLGEMVRMGYLRYENGRLTPISR